uniref:BTB domain-containing protein n=1 Tax=Globodera pallida TaxID=36090 RepID=A0A183CTF8_GLOPA
LTSRWSSSCNFWRPSTSIFDTGKLIQIHKCAALLKLADHFQIDWLKERCEAHLINCVEIPLIERFLLIKPYGLNNLKDFFLSLNLVTLRAFLKANHEQQLLLTDSISPQFWTELAIRLCREQ